MKYQIHILKQTVICDLPKPISAEYGWKLLKIHCPVVVVPHKHNTLQIYAKKLEATCSENSDHCDIRLN